MELEKAAFGMGCFWGPDALLGSLDSVVRTRVGYAGGEKEDPTYRDLGNHTETVLVEYDPDRIEYVNLLDVFWENHDFRAYRKPQYASKIFCLDDEQEELAEITAENYPDAETGIEMLEDFTVAEDYHQKYRLRHSKLMENFEDLDDSEFRDSPLAAKLNAYVAGHLELGDLEELELEVEPGLKDRILNRIRNL